MNSEALYGIAMSGLALVVVVGILVMIRIFVGNLLTISPEGLTGLACFGSMFVGILSLVFGLFACVVGQMIPGGVCFLASGVSFGLLSNALLRK